MFAEPGESIMTNRSRSETDVAFAYSVGREFGPILDPGRLRLLTRADRSAFFSTMLRNLMGRVGRHISGSEDSEPLDFAASESLIGDIESALRLLSFGEDLGIGVVVYAEEWDDSLDQPVLFDVFNPRAWRMLSPDSNDPMTERRHNLRNWIKTVVRERKTLRLVPLEDARMSFVTLFADSLVTLVRGSGQNRSSHVNFTVNSGHGYQLEYHPQYKTSPLVFGTHNSSPVTQTILIGRYHFQGWKNNVFTADTGTYPASAYSPSATLRAF